MSRPPRDDDYWEQVAEEQQAERDGYRTFPAAETFHLNRAENRYEKHMGW